MILISLFRRIISCPPEDQAAIDAGELIISYGTDLMEQDEMAEMAKELITAKEAKREIQENAAKCIPLDLFLWQSNFRTQY